jgi:hypothetical protein
MCSLPVGPSGTIVIYGSIRNDSILSMEPLNFENPKLGTVTKHAIRNSARHNFEFPGKYVTDNLPVPA